MCMYLQCNRHSSSMHQAYDCVAAVIGAGIKEVFWRICHRLRLNTINTAVTLLCTCATMSSSL